MAHGVHDKKPNQICLEHILETTVTIFSILKPRESLCTTDMHWVDHFAEGLMEPEFCPGYISATTGLIFRI